MGLTVAIGNALSGLKVSQSALEVISRNISNAGTPGYHKQTINVIEVGRGDNSYVRAGKVERSFDSILQNYYTKQVPETAFSATRGSFMDRLQTALGKPGSAGSLDSVLGKLSGSLDSLATSPDNYATRAEVVAQATNMANTLNRLSLEVQSMRRETETRMATAVDQVNSMLGSLRDVNMILADYGVDQNTRNSLLDQRDRIVSGLSEMMDLRVDYNTDGTVRVSTLSGASMLDVKPSKLVFEQAGSLNAASQFNVDDAQSNVGKLVIETPNGTRVDLVKDGAIRSGTLGALINMRDTVLQDAQKQLDDIAGALAQVFSTVQTPATEATGSPQGYSVDLAKLQDGNDVVMRYRDANGIEHNARIVRVDDPSKLPLTTPDSLGTQVVGINFANGGPIGTIDMNYVATVLNSSLNLGPTFNVNAGTTLDIRANSNALPLSATSRWTPSQDQAGDLGFNLFVDSDGTPFTNSLSGKGQRLGFASRITVNPDVITDNKLLVNYAAGTSAGDSKRVDYLVEQFNTLRFGSNSAVAVTSGGFRLSGTLSDMVFQTMEYQGSTISTALSTAEANSQTLDAITSRMDEKYGVDINEEVARLMELQNAYAANARVASVVQELLNTLMQTFS
ncbi:Flagellar hook-associated protein 1 [Devosia equisanguinis]|uniref:Flagellar hook-associated protein 1 n=1 Tax=Devosia equisanguinis TaxID=2490941 RepID=A0A3S4D7Z8_9HYPH|nr:flagellar hook-associated protein FlgK [Devosia equisanguinis]VDS06545.1 Flagellar hook-associated protein 1 [Devosia equisanguinis]